MSLSIGHNVNPFHDPRVFDAMTSVVKEIIRAAEFRHESCIPGIVEDFDRDTHLVTVRPLVKHVDYDNKAFEALPFTVSLWRLQIGGFLIDSPVYKGDVGWIIGSDRTTQNVKIKNGRIQEKNTVKVRNGKTDYGTGNQGPQEPNGHEMHKYTEGFFIPDSWGNIKIPEEHKDSLLIQTIDRNGKASGRISISSKGKIGIESESEGVEITGDVRAKGNASLKGELAVTDGVNVGDVGQIAISGGDIGGRGKAKFRKVRFATGKRNGRLSYMKAYVLATSPSEDGTDEVGTASGTSSQPSSGGGDAPEYTLKSGDNSSIQFSVDGGAAQSTLTVNSELDGKTVKMDVYYI